MKLTQQEKTIKIARATGWRDFGFYEDNAGPSFWHGEPPEEWWATQPSHIETARKGFGIHLSDYFGNLNACREMESHLTDNQWDRYCDVLGGSLRRCASATASERAEAFGLTLKLWEPGQ